jgi:hypothetical protein
MSCDFEEFTFASAVALLHVGQRVWRRRFWQPGRASGHAPAVTNADAQSDADADAQSDTDADADYL